MPAETGVIEIDHTQILAVDEHVLGHKVGMYHSVVLRLRTMRSQLVGDPRAGTSEKLALILRERFEFPEPPPKRLLPHETRSVPGMTSKSDRTLPYYRLVMYPSGDRSNRVVLAVDGCALSSKTGLYRTQLASVDPLEHV